MENGGKNRKATGIAQLSSYAALERSPPLTFQILDRLSP